MTKYTQRCIKKVKPSELGDCAAFYNKVVWDYCSFLFIVISMGMSPLQDNVDIFRLDHHQPTPSSAELCAGYFTLRNLYRAPWLLFWYLRLACVPLCYPPKYYLLEISSGSLYLQNTNQQGYLPRSYPSILALKPGVSLLLIKLLPRSGLSPQLSFSSHFYRKLNSFGIVPNNFDST